MSEENVPKLRLKPKLVAAPVIVPSPPAAEPFSPPAPPAPPVPTADNEPKAVRLKPKLGPAPSQETAPTPPPAPAEIPDTPPWGAAGAFPPPPTASDSSDEPLAAVEKSAAKFMLRPKAVPEGLPAVAAAFPPPRTEIPASAAQDSIPPSLFIDPEQSGDSSTGTNPRSTTVSPFPSSAANFPPPPGGGNSPAPPWSQPKVKAKRLGRNFLKLGVGGLFVALILGGAFVAYKKFVVPPPPAAEVATVPKAPEPVVPAPAKAKLETKPVAAVPPAVAPVVEKAVAAPKPVEVDEPPPPSAEFKAWVDALRVGGVRAGANTRVFIGGTAYAPGEMVDPQLGITFDGYNAGTRHLIFKDKTGATVERRN